MRPHHFSRDLSSAARAESLAYAQGLQDRYAGAALAVSVLRPEPENLRILADAFESLDALYIATKLRFTAQAIESFFDAKDQGKYASLYNLRLSETFDEVIAFLRDGLPPAYLSGSVAEHEGGLWLFVRGSTDIFWQGRPVPALQLYEGNTFTTQAFGRSGSGASTSFAAVFGGYRYAGRAKLDRDSKGTLFPTRIRLKRGKRETGWMPSRNRSRRKRR
jgi:hypothetical protein